jgi:NAD(P)-dependent dehydrogenase (short-subunit alcohol dehydrogenase family)
MRAEAAGERGARPARLRARGLRVLVTGAGGGLGTRLVEALAAAGGEVLAADLPARLPALPGGSGLPGGDRIFPLAMDVTDSASVRAARPLAEAGGLDGIVCAAGIFAGGALSEMAEAELLRCMDVNVMGSFRVVRELLPALRPGARIVLVSSDSVRPVMPFTGPYAMSKCALEAFAHSLRRELSIVGVRVSVVRPGAIRTPFLESAGAALSRFAGSSPFAAALSTARRMLSRERDAAMPPSRVARVILRALTSPRPRPIYRVGNEPGRALLGLLPSSAVDLLIRLFLRGRAG